MTESSNTKPANKGGRKRKGSLQFRTRQWYAVLTVDVDGETVRKWTPLDTNNKAVARRKLARLVAEHSTVDDVDELTNAAKAPETYAELATRVRLQRRDRGVSDVRSEEGREDTWILPEIGKLTVEAVRAEHIAGIYENVRAAGKSMAHLRNIRTVLRSRFAVAFEEETIQANPVDRARLPKVKIDRRERAVLTDDELVRYLAWQHPDEQYRLAVLERQTMSALARMFGGLRTGDLHATRWDHFDTKDGAFTIGVALRKKTARPQRIGVPEMLRPILRDWWERQGRPTTGLIFPALRGKRASKSDVGVSKQGVSHADAFRRDLSRCFGIEVFNADSGKWERPEGRQLTEREREVLVETEFTRPVDFHSWRRAFKRALDDAGVGVQQAMALSGATDLGAHGRYLWNSSRVHQIPECALPALGVSLQPATIQKAFRSQLRDLNSGPAVYETVQDHFGVRLRESRIVNLRQIVVLKARGVPCRRLTDLSGR